MMYFDSNIFVYALIYDHQLEDFKKADYYLQRIVKAEIIGYTSTLTWDEVFYVIKKNNDLDKAIQASNVFLKLPNLCFINVDFSVILEAHNIIRESGIMPRDAIHAACAIKYCNGNIVSNDNCFDNINKMKRIY